MLFANPENGQVMSGEASINDTPGHLVVHSADRSIIHWDSFSIDSGEITQFVLGDVNTAVLNRVQGEEISSLLGSLQSNGKVYLVNPNGIVIGQEGIIDTASFIGATFDITDEAFNTSGDLHFTGDSVCSISNQGVIKAEGGNILLFAHRVENNGTLDAKKGDVHIGSGYDILLAMEGKELLLVRPELPGAGILNEGTIDAVRALLSAHSNPYELGIQNDGIIHTVGIEKLSEEYYIIERAESVHLVNDEEVPLVVGEEQELSPEILQIDGHVHLLSKGALFSNRGTISADSCGKVNIDLEGARGENYGTIQALGGDLSISCIDDHSEEVFHCPFSNYRTIDVSGPCVGNITLNIPKFENVGTVLAIGGGGKIEINASERIVETADAMINVDGSDGIIQITAGIYTTSGVISANGEFGGTVDIEVEKLNASAARFEANGSVSGGEIHLKTTSEEEKMLVNSKTVISAIGKEEGGRIQMDSPLPIPTRALISVSGKREGVLVIPSNGIIEEIIPEVNVEEEIIDEIVLEEELKIETDFTEEEASEL